MLIIVKSSLQINETKMNYVVYLRFSFFILGEIVLS